MMVVDHRKRGAIVWVSTDFLLLTRHKDLLERPWQQVLDALSESLVSQQKLQRIAAALSDGQCHQSTVVWFRRDDHVPLKVVLRAVPLDARYSVFQLTEVNVMGNFGKGPAHLWTTEEVAMWLHKRSFTSNVRRYIAERDLDGEELFSEMEDAERVIQVMGVTEYHWLRNALHIEDKFRREASFQIC